ncbi:response regulator transcription factor [Thermohalobacter berrensis]|uniref:Uncharacterized protein n=1 Tax=Thermohalobacter berrensis TaxID=99594 RepID=A0A419T5S4_9FIRM|nr:response regulator [Thermohalobacter berrensis]RKD32748.1 hypothetical protein BET03_10465 [Thermohalobacter berrensis]
MYKVLIVEDEYLEREALKLILSEKSNEITIAGEATTGSSAISLYKELCPHIMLIDIKVPCIDGIEVAERIREKDNNIAIIIITAYDDFALVQKALRIRVDDYILKPATPKQIMTSIDKVTKRISSKESIFSRKLNDLEKSIKLKQYKSSKEKLNSLLKYLFLINQDNRKKLKNDIQFIAFKLIKIADDMMLEIKEKDYIKKISKTKNEWLQKEMLLKLLYEMFDDLIENKKYNCNSEIVAVLNYIEKNYHKGITLKEVADYIGLSPYYLSRLFKKELGINFITYVTERKIEKGKDLLANTDMPISNIALELSFKEPNYFTKVFKKIVGLTPSQYRKKVRKEMTKKYNRLQTNRYIFNNKKYYV